MDVRVGRGREGGNSNQRKQELKTLPKQGCVEQMLGNGVDICLKYMCGLGAEMKDQSNVGGKEGLGSR